MGYPMTWQRLLNRNGLADGDYMEPPPRWDVRVNILPDIPTEAIGSVMQARAERLFQYVKAVQLLAGDLRRLEKDTVDEQATCREIARRTGIDVDTVAAVLKEFISW